MLFPKWYQLIIPVASYGDLQSNTLVAVPKMHFYKIYSHFFFLNNFQQNLSGFFFVLFFFNENAGFNAK